MTITPGSRLGQYEIVSLIGGGMVYTLPGQTKIKECVITREAVLAKDIPTTLVEKSGIRWKSTFKSGRDIPKHS